MQAIPYERRKKRRIKPVTVFVLSLCLTLLMSSAHIYYSCMQEYQKQLQNAEIYGKYFSQKTALVMENLAQSLYVLSSIIRWQNGKTDYFEEIAGYLIQIIPETININLAKDGVVSHVYPYKQNEIALGHNLLLSPARKDEALKAVVSREVTVAGPMALLQGGRGLAFRQAVFLPKELKEIQEKKNFSIEHKYDTADEHFWGFVIITYDFPKIMHRLNYEELTLAGLSWNLWRTNPHNGQKISVISSNPSSENEILTFKVPLQNETWYLDVSPCCSVFNQKLLLEALLYLFICALVSLLITFIFILQNKNKIIERQSNTDTLTNLPNRKYFYSLLKKALQKHFNSEHAEGDAVMHICVLDLNDFKLINDTYGHVIGDKILIEFSQRISQSLLPHEFASRLGGDEFLAVYYCPPAQNIPTRLADIQNFLQQPYNINGEQHIITASLGYICPTKDMLEEKKPEQSYEEFFLEKADRIMYQNKHHYHQNKSA